MIGILLNDNAYEQDIRELLMAFFPGESFVHEWKEDLSFSVRGILSDDRKTFDLQAVSRGVQEFHPWDMT